ncbi:MAG: hypothetical protein ACT4P7_17940 [Gemmatimonadaceae bacterium]
MTPPVAAPRPAEAAIGVRRAFLHQHLVAAQSYANGASAAEQRGLASLGREDIDRYHDLVAAAILSSAAFLEASVDALFRELQEGGLTNGRHHPRRFVAHLTRTWRANEGASTLHKYQLLLALWDADPFHPGRSPFLEADRLTRRRDLLLLRESDPRATHSTATRRARPSTSTEHFRLDAACAEWAVQVAISFSVEFCRRMSIPEREFREAG